MNDDSSPGFQHVLAEFLAETRFEDLPAQVVRRTRWVLADTLAVIAGGMQEPEPKALARMIADEEGTGPATVIGSRLRLGMAHAAFLHGTAGTFLELDEGNQYCRGHPGIHVVPCALGRAEASDAGMDDLLLAIAVGYEIGARIGIASRIRMSMHPHGTWGTVAAAVTAGKLGGCDARQFRALINISASLGLATSRRTMLEGGTVRNSYAGFSNEVGIRAEQMLRAGITGERDGLGVVFGSVVSESFDEAALLAELGTRWEVARNYFKRHACCRYNHGSLDALQAIAAGQPGGRLDPARVAGVQVHTYSLAAQLSDQEPDNMLAAKFSVPFAVATTLVHGEARVEQFRPPALHDEAVRALARKVTVHEDPTLTAMMPAHRPSRVEVALDDGRVLSAQVMSNRGDTEDPYPESELETKFLELGEPVWGAARSGEILERAMGMAGNDPVRRLCALLPSR